MSEQLDHWFGGAPVLPLDNTHKGDLEIWAAGAPVVKKPKKNANVRPDGVACTASVGTVTINGAAAISATGLLATTALGTATVTGAAAHDATGLSCTAFVGTVTVEAEEEEEESPPQGGGSSLGARRRPAAWPKVRRHNASVWLRRGLAAETALGQVSLQTDQRLDIRGHARAARTRLGQVRISASASASVGLFPQMAVPAGSRRGTPAVRAIRNPTDEELLLAAAVLMN